MDDSFPSSETVLCFKIIQSRSSIHLETNERPEVAIKLTFFFLFANLSIFNIVCFEGNFQTRGKFGARITSRERQFVERLNTSITREIFLIPETWNS